MSSNQENVDPSTARSRFNELLWHDSKLIGFSLAREWELDRLALQVELRTSNGMEPVIVTFLECTYLRLAIDVEGKRVCSDDISEGACEQQSKWISELAARSPHDDFSGYLHFRIT